MIFLKSDFRHPFRDFAIYSTNKFFADFFVSFENRQVGKLVLWYPGAFGYNMIPNLLPVFQSKDVCGTFTNIVNFIKESEHKWKT